MGAAVKTNDYRRIIDGYGISDENVIYVGDDIPDYQVMRLCGCPCCPHDACSDIKKISAYISSADGGEGVARDVLEQVLRVQGKWLSDAEAFGW